MTYTDFFVGGLAIILGLLAIGFAVGPWQWPYQLRTISKVHQRFGKPMARSVWVVIALAAFGAGTAIMAGIRPDYASPTVSDGP